MQNIFKNEVENNENPQISSSVECFHCGVKTKNPLRFEQHDFCCNGCKNVYSILQQNDLCQYYDLNSNPGNTIESSESIKYKFNFLEDEKMLSELISFKSNEVTKLNFYLPQIHCSSCLYLLENLHQIHSGVVSAQLQFTQKELSVTFNHHQITAKEVALLLTNLGYEPYFSLGDIINKKKIKPSNNKRLYRLGVAGFAFSNIMLLSFPEYFDWGKDLDGLSPYFQWFNLLLSLPVVFYSAQEFYILAWGGLKKRFLNIDLPIVLALFITFGRSLFEMYTHSGPGYFDSLTGIVFFMLLGRYLQDKTYESLSFSRDYTSYFPLSAHIWKTGKEVEIALDEIQPGDELVIHDQEIIPTDGQLVHGTAIIDYSFVTGEARPIQVKEGEWVYAGGRQLEGSIRVLAQKTVSQGYLVSLWNQSNDEKESDVPIDSDENHYIHVASQWFTVVLFSIAILGSVYWSFVDSSKIWHVLTSVLIVACPCALLLSVTFTNGHILSALARKGLFVKNAKSLERWRNVNVGVFDKTGTLTEMHRPEIEFFGKELDSDQLDVIAAVAKQSIHPYARAIAKYLDRAQVAIENVKNIPGKGVSAISDGVNINMGSRDFVGLSSLEVSAWGNINLSETDKLVGGEVWVKFGDIVLGRFIVKSRYRINLKPMLEKFRQKMGLAVISGDNDSEKPIISNILPPKVPVIFQVKPIDKQRYIQDLQVNGKRVMMVGDGLNDAGALNQADFSIAITENVGLFSPGCDAIMLGDSLPKLYEFWKLAQRARRIIWWSFAISILYNIVGLSFALTAQLNPLVAAILMPVSSISIVTFTYVASNWGYWKKEITGNSPL